MAGLCFGYQTRSLAGDHPPSSLRIRQEQQYIKRIISESYI